MVVRASALATGTRQNRPCRASNIAAIVTTPLNAAVSFASGASRWGAAVTGRVSILEDAVDRYLQAGAPYEPAARGPAGARCRARTPPMRPTK